MGLRHTRTRTRTLTLLVIGIGACSHRTSDDDRAIDVAASAPEGPRPACPVFTRGGECRAVVPDDVVTLASGGGLVLPAAWFPTKSGGSLAFGIRWGEAHLLSVKSDRAFEFAGAFDLPFEETRGATGVNARGAGALYFVGRAADGLRLHVTRVDNGEVETAVPVAIEGATATPSWPQAVGLRDGRTLLAFVEPQRHVFVGVDDGQGTTFHMTEPDLHEPDLSGVLAHVGVTSAGSWVLTYQLADASLRFRSGVVVSKDSGASWSAPIALSPSAGESLADAFPIARIDGGADIYYARGSTGHASVRRRALSEDGSLGQEQVVTSEDVGWVQKPQPRRLADGRLAMMFTIALTARTGVLSLAMLDGDAPKP